MFKSIEFFKGKSRGEGGGLLRRYTSRNDICSAGRSMIEMLGVLAIVGVLSVGGIAGYSKAMEMWKINKAVNEYVFLIQGLMEARQSLRKFEHNTGLVDFVKSMNLVPQSWNTLAPDWIADGYGNHLHLYIGQNDLSNIAHIAVSYRIAFDIAIGGYMINSDNVSLSPNFSAKLCSNIYRNLVIPLHSTLIYGSLFRSNGSIRIYGDNYCHRNGYRCLKDLSLAEIDEICNSCRKESERCAVSMAF